MDTCLLDDAKFGLSFLGYRRSRSSEDLSSKLSEGTMFSRQGAMRKRQSNANPEKRHSSVNLSTQEYSDGDVCKTCLIERSPMVNEAFFRSPSKSANGFIRVLNVFQTSKKEIEKDDGRKKSYRSRFSEKKSLSNEDSIQAVINAIIRIIEPILSCVNPGNWRIESSWADVVIGRENFTKTECDKQAAIWELIETEASCLNFFFIVTEIFLPVFTNLQNQYDELFPINKYELFGNIDHLYHSHLKLWERSISKPLLKSRFDNGPLDISLMKDGFLSISTIFESYNLFMHMQGQINKVLHEQEKTNSYMREFINWTKSYDKSNRFGILSIATYPFQRITKYKILLDRIKDFSNELEKQVLDEMIKAVHDFLEHINSIVTGEKRLEEIKQKLVDISVVKCDYVDIFQIIDRQFIVFDITKSLKDFPDRVLIHVGHLKLYLDKNKAMDVECFLFNDLFLVCKQHKKDRNKLEIFKSPIRLDKLLVKLLKENTFVAIILNDFMTVNGIMVFGGTSDEVKLWMDKCNRARTSFVNKFESSLRVPVKDFFQISELSSNSSTYHPLKIYEDVLVNGEIQRSIRTDSDAVSENSICTDFSDKQISVDTNGIIIKDEDNEIYPHFSSFRSNEKLFEEMLIE